MSVKNNPSAEFEITDEISVVNYRSESQPRHVEIIQSVVVLDEGPGAASIQAIELATCERCEINIRQRCVRCRGKTFHKVYRRHVDFISAWLHMTRWRRPGWWTIATPRC